MQPIWKVYSVVHESDTFETLLDELYSYQATGDIRVLDLDFDDFRLDSYDDGNALSMSVRDMMCIHMRLDVEFRRGCLSGCHVVFEWWDEGREHRVRFE
jgi:hypothetical protein